MNILIIGGVRNGDWVETIDNAKVWLDIVHATTHVIRKITWTITDMQSRPAEAFELRLAVHPQIVGPAEQEVAGNILTMLAMAEFARAHGTVLEIPKEPPIAVPDTPAGLFGPDGRPLT